MSPALNVTDESTPLVPLAFARGDGVGPEIMDAVLAILEQAGARLDLKEIHIGQSVYEVGHTSGIDPDSWKTVRETGLLLKSPITTPQGGGYKSLNVTLRKSLGLFANVRPCRAFAPWVPTHYPDMDVLIVRENEEDTYAGIEHRQTAEVTQCLKLITRPGCERVIRHAFELARATGRKKVTCMTKDNIMKITDGIFHDIFNRMAPEYPDIVTENLIIDIGSAHMATNPERFDVVVTPNLYGDIISDIAAQVAGSVGLVGSANIGAKAAMFEAIHGSAPDIAGQDIANPSGLLRGAVMLLVHVGQTDVAERVENAWRKTLEDGIHTADIFSDSHSKERVGTQAFGEAVAARLGEEPTRMEAVRYATPTDNGAKEPPALSTPPAPVKTLTGVDIFIDWTGSGRDPNVLGKALETACVEPFKLKMITNRGVKVYPDGLPETFCTDHWRCRFIAKDGGAVPAVGVVALQSALVEAGQDVIKTENLYEFDGVKGYSLGQGE